MLKPERTHTFLSVVGRSAREFTPDDGTGRSWVELRSVDRCHRRALRPCHLIPHGDRCAVSGCDGELGHRCSQYGFQLHDDRSGGSNPLSYPVSGEPSGHRVLCDSTQGHRSDGHHGCGLPVLEGQNTAVSRAGCMKRHTVLCATV